MTKGQASPHRGSLHYGAKLTESAVIWIRKSGESLTRMARRFGVAKCTVHAAKLGRRWKHVELLPPGGP
jgi:hypothetical protein